MTVRAKSLAGVLGMAVGLLLLAASPARADDLANVIPNLFGAGGIRLNTVPLGCCPQGHQPHFTVASTGQLTSLNDALRAQLATIPLPSPASGFTFQLDPALGTFVRSTEGFGPIYADRAETIGKGRFSIGFSYSRFDFTQLDGDDLDDGEVTLAFGHEPTSAINTTIGLPNNAGRPFAFERDTIAARISADITQDVFLFTATYGILDSLDVSIALPVIRVKMDVTGVATSNEESGTRLASGAGVHTFADGSNTLTSTASEESTGIGDLILRAKYNFYREKPFALAAGLDLRLPTGDEDELRGLGAVVVSPFFVASGGPWYGVSPHVNLGFNLAASDSVDNEFFYRVGFDWTPVRFLTFAFDVLGRYIFDNSRVQTDGQPAGDSIVDASFGVKANVWKNVLVVANVLVPLNNTGLRASFVPFFGVEVSF